MKSLGRALIQGLVSLWEEDVRTQTHREERLYKDKESTAICKSKTDASEETNATDTLILNF